MKAHQLGLIKSKSPGPQKSNNAPTRTRRWGWRAIWSRGDKALDGETLDIFSADIDPNAPGLNLVDEDRRLSVAKGYGDSYAELLFELCEDHRIDVLVPAMSCELLLLARAGRLDITRLCRAGPGGHQVDPCLRRSGQRQQEADPDCLALCSREAKILDIYGCLDLPAELDGIDAVYAASHQAPSPDGPMNPRSTRERIEAGELDPQMVLRWIISGTGRRAPPRREPRHSPFVQRPSSAWAR